jgi:hypothetical protein
LFVGTSKKPSIIDSHFAKKGWIDCQNQDINNIISGVI